MISNKQSLLTILPNKTFVDKVSTLVVSAVSVAVSVTRKHRQMSVKVAQI